MTTFFAGLTSLDNCDSRAPSDVRRKLEVFSGRTGRPFWGSVTRAEWSPLALGLTVTLSSISSLSSSLLLSSVDASIHLSVLPLFVLVNRTNTAGVLPFPSFSTFIASVSVHSVSLSFTRSFMTTSVFTKHPPFLCTISSTFSIRLLTCSLSLGRRLLMTWYLPLQRRITSLSPGSSLSRRVFGSRPVR